MERAWLAPKNRKKDILNYVTSQKLCAMYPSGSSWMFSQESKSRNKKTSDPIQRGQQKRSEFPG